MGAEWAEGEGSIASIRNMDGLPSRTIESSCVGRLGSVNKGIGGNAGHHLNFAYFSWMNFIQ